MSRRRPVRAWVGEARPVDPAELLGPRGLTRELLEEPCAPEADEPLPAMSDETAFWLAMLTDQRRARIDSVVDARLSSVGLVLDRLLDPHNIAAALRTAEGLGLAEVLVVPHEDGEVGAHRRVTQDADKWIDVRQEASGAACAAALRERGFAVYAGHLDAGAVPLWELPCHRPIALLFGNEHQGPSAETISACSGTFRIPMAGFTQSFNVSVAAGIALSQVCHARRQVLGAAGDLPPAAREALRHRFYKLGAKLSKRIRPKVKPAPSAASNEK